MFKVLVRDITTLQVDAIVNAANESLLGGGGVDGAIMKRGGESLLIACAMLKGCKTGEAKITPGFNLPAKHVIHTVGPVWQGGTNNEKEALEKCYESVFHIAKANNIKSIAFPAISCGAFGFPVKQAAEIAKQAIRSYGYGFDVYISCFDERTANNFRMLT